MAKKLIANVGLNLKDDRRYEQGQQIDEKSLNAKQRSYLLAEGYATEIEAPVAPPTSHPNTAGVPKVATEAVGSLKPKKGKGK